MLKGKCSIKSKGVVVKYNLTPFTGFTMSEEQEQDI